jgi:hypothetical protein
MLGKGTGERDNSLGFLFDSHKPGFCASAQVGATIGKNIPKSKYLSLLVFKVAKAGQWLTI